MVLFSMLLIVTDGFGILPSEGGLLQKTDMLLLPTLYICYTERKRDKKFFSIKKDGIGKVVVIIIAFICLEYLRTIIYSIDSPIWALKVVRLQFFMLIYFYLRAQDMMVWKKFFRLALVFSFLQGVLYYLQLVGLTGILTREIDAAADNVRYGNYPMLTSFFIIYYLAYRGSNRTKIIMLLYWGMMILLGQSRGAILGIAGVFFMLVLVQRNRKGLLLLAAGVAVYFFILNPLLAKRDSGERASTSNDISFLMNSSANEMANAQIGQIGNVAFRFGMLAERWVYLTDNPEYIPMGVGCIHEESPANRFRFVLGTINEKFTWGKCMIESGDITWVPILLRFGVIGILLYGMLLIIWLFFSFRNYTSLSSPFSKTSCLMSACIITTSVGTTVFDATYTMFLLCIYLGMLMSDEYLKNQRMTVGKIEKVSKMDI